MRPTGTRRSVILMVIVIFALLLAGWGTLIAVVIPGEYAIGNHPVFGWGLAITAFVLGVRHAFDADHIAAIDNSTRKLVDDGRRPVSVGFWFALGHSSVVVVTVALLSAGVRALADQITDGGSILSVTSAVWGPLFSGVFLLLIGTLNLISLGGIYGVFRALKAGKYDEAQLEALLKKRGLMSRLLAPLARRVDEPWKMFPIGVLFGLGFDTASTIALFVVGGGAALVAPWYVVMVLPVLFTAGMTLFDTLDGMLMIRTYQWAYARPIRKIYYNMTVTAMSVAIAFTVGIISLSGMLADALQVDRGLLAWLACFDLENFGIIIVGLLLGTWLVSFAFWKLGRMESRYGKLLA